MTLSMLAKISAAYIGLAVTFATASVAWETGREIAGPSGVSSLFQGADVNSAG